MLKFHLVTDKIGLSEDTLRPRARICIEGSVITEGNKQFISPDCLTFNEVDTELKRIEKNILLIRRNARNCFKDTPWA